MRHHGEKGKFFSGYDLSVNIVITEIVCFLSYQTIVTNYLRNVPADAVSGGVCGTSNSTDQTMVLSWGNGWKFTWNFMQKEKKFHVSSLKVEISGEAIKTSFPDIQESVTESEYYVCILPNVIII